MKRVLLALFVLAACSKDQTQPAPSAGPVSIDRADALPGQVRPGGTATLSWATTNATRVTVTGGAGTVTEVPGSGSLVVSPGATSVYTLSAFGGDSPVTARLVVRVALPPAVSGFAAVPPAIALGSTATLSWSGNATSYSITSDQGETFELGPRRKLVVRPGRNTVYTLHALGPGGALAVIPTAAVTVDASHPASRLLYTPSAASAPLQLVADACADPCTQLTLRVMAGTTALRGFAITLPLDDSKVALVPGSFHTALGGPAKAVAGSGPLAGTLVLGAALEGDGSAVAPDVTAAGGELASFALALVPGTGRGSVFSGQALATNPVYKAVVQTASGRTANALAVGALDAD